MVSFLCSLTGSRRRQSLKQAAFICTSSLAADELAMRAQPEDWILEIRQTNKSTCLQVLMGSYINARALPPRTLLPACVIAPSAI